jgi:hypothetical protein
VPQGSLVALLAQHGLKKTPWYALLDAAQDPMLPRRARWAGLPVQSLYAGRLGAMLDDVAPHQVALEPFDSPFTQALLASWPKTRTLFLQSKADFHALRKHFRKFLMVKDEAGKRYRFRYYDPRVLRPFLASSTVAETKEFFGPVEAFYLPDDKPDTALMVRLGAKGATAKAIGGASKTDEDSD